jgi:hypothetical protein
MEPRKTVRDAPMTEEWGATPLTSRPHIAPSLDQCRRADDGILVCKRRQAAMRLEVMEASGSAKKLLARLAACGSVGLLALAVSSFVDASSATADVTVKPMTVSLKAKVGNSTYGIVTIANTGSSAETLTGAANPNSQFWPTWGGTCNSSAVNKVVAPGRSCTFEFGFKPTQTGQVSDQGTITFQSGASLTVQLKGVGQ